MASSTGFFRHPSHRHNTGEIADQLARSPGWRAFLRNHTAHIAGIDLFVVPTVGFKLLYGLVILRLERRQLVWTNVTASLMNFWLSSFISRTCVSGYSRHCCCECSAART